MNVKTLFLAGLLLIAAAAPMQAQVRIDGFLQGLYGGRLDNNNPTETEYTASETRMQLRAEHFGENVEFFGRLDFLYDGALEPEYDWELREGYLKFRLGNSFDFKVGRQVLTWGTGDLIFINDVFAKDYRSFFVGRDDQYLKAPQNAMRIEYYNPLANLTVVWSPRYEPNRLPTGRRLSYYNPMIPGIVGTGMNEMFYFEPPLPEAKFKNSEIATRLSRSVAGFNTSLYFYHGFYKNPVGMQMINDSTGMPYYPALNVYGASIRGAVMGGVLWMEGGYLDSRDDPDGDNPLVQNSSVTGMVGFERQIATNLTVNGQWQVDYMLDYDMFDMQQPAGAFVRSEVRHTVTSRVTRLMMDENLTLSGFVFFSPSDEDVYFRFSGSYKYSDELTLAVGGNVFAGEHPNTDFGQFQQNDNLYLKMTYGF
ncbi:MAG: hypothetical protein KKA42_09725 [candidate division Zixibacteria bacterium]|nr:hypothetical protein [candidate division Zixibacteria bacterium]